MWPRLARLLVDRRRACAGLAVLLTLAALPGALRIRFREDLTSILPAGNAATGAFRRVNGTGHLTDSLWILLETDGAAAAAPGTLTSFAEAMAAGLRAAPAVREVRLSLAPDADAFAVYAQDRLPLYLDNAGFAEFLGRLAPDAMARALAGLKRRLEGGPPLPGGVLASDPLGLRALLRDRLAAGRAGYTAAPDLRYCLSRDGRALLLMVEGRRPARETAHAREIVAAAQTAEAAARAAAGALGKTPPVTVRLAGGYAVAVESERVIRSDLILTTVTSLPLVLLLFLAAFRGRASAIVASVPPALSLAWTAGAAGWAAGELSPLTVTLAAMLAGLSIDFPIHLYHVYQMERAGGAAPEDAAVAAVARSGAGLTTAALTTIAAFLVLYASALPGLRQLGGLAAAGLASGWLAALLVVPAAAIALDRAGAPGRHAQPRWLERAYGWAANCTTRRRGLVLAVSGLAAAGAATLLALPPAGVRFEDDADRLRPADDPTLATQQRILDHFGGGFDTVLVVVEGRDMDEALAGAAAAADALRPGVSGGRLAAVEGPADWLPPTDLQARRREVLRAAGPDAVIAAFDAAVTRSGLQSGPFADYRQWLRTILAPAPAALDSLPVGVAAELRRRFLGTDDAGAFALVYAAPRTRLPRAAQREEFLERVRAPLAAARAPITLTGAVPLLASLDCAARAETARLMLLSAAAVLAFVLLHFRSPPAALLTLVPVAAGLLGTAALMRALDLRINHANLVVFGWLIGMGVDNGVHLVEQARRRGGGADAAVRGMGRALSMTGLTTVAGFGSLLFASHPLVRSLGQVTALGVACSLAGALFTLPALLARKDGNAHGA